jgi:hypothetical protein
MPWVLHERGGGQSGELRWCVRPNLHNLRRLAIAMERDERERIGRLERRPAGKHPEEDDPERVDVARRGRDCASRLLGRDVRRGAEHGALANRPLTFVGHERRRHR